MNIDWQRLAVACLVVGRRFERLRGTRRIPRLHVAWAGQFTHSASYALRAAKESIDKGLEVDLVTGLEIERIQFAALFATEDRTIGMTTFMEKGPGKAEFRGR